tara:strand:- start:397 stop:1008 length:612 start_codon:yes stop_codon:yes gene_type:complete
VATLSAQIQALAGTNVTESELNQFCEDGVRELVNIFPQNLKEMCYSKNTLSTSAAVGSESETIATQHIGSVYAGASGNEVRCRQINPKDKYLANDPESIHFATKSDPVYYIEGSKINILPASSSGIYYAIADPSITANTDSAISSFPNEAEYLVVLYAAIKTLESLAVDEEDPELFLPVLQNLKQDYAQGLQALGVVQTQQAG